MYDKIVLHKSKSPISAVQYPNADLTICSEKVRWVREIWIFLPIVYKNCRKPHSGIKKCLTYKFGILWDAAIPLYLFQPWNIIDDNLNNPTDFNFNFLIVHGLWDAFIKLLKVLNQIAVFRRIKNQ